MYNPNALNSEIRNFKQSSNRAEFQQYLASVEGENSFLKQELDRKNQMLATQHDQISQQREQLRQMEADMKDKAQRISKLESMMQQMLTPQSARVEQDQQLFDVSRQIGPRSFKQDQMEPGNAATIQLDSMSNSFHGNRQFSARDSHQGPAY